MFRHHDEDDSNKKWMRHNDDIHDEDVENQQPLPHPMPPIALPHVSKPKHYLCKFFTIIFLYIVPKPKLYFKKILPLYFRTLFQNPSFISVSFLPLYFRTLSQKPKLYLYKFFTIIFPYIVPKPKQSRASQLVTNTSDLSASLLHS